MNGDGIAANVDTVGTVERLSLHVPGAGNAMSQVNIYRRNAARFIQKRSAKGADMATTPEKVIGKLATRLFLKIDLDSALFTRAGFKDELQPLADLIRAAQEIAEKVPRDQCLGKWNSLDNALEKLGSI